MKCPIKKRMKNSILILVISALLLTGCAGRREPATEPTSAQTNINAQNKPTFPKPGAPSGETVASEVPTETEATVTEPTQTEPTQTEPEAASGGTVEDVRKQLTDQNKLFAVAYLGYLPYGEESALPFLEDCASTAEQLAFLKDIPETNIGSAILQGEVYCIVPVDPDATVRFYAGTLLEDNYMVYDELIYEGTGKDPYILVCNATYYSDMEVAIEFPDGLTYRWYPKLDEYQFVVGLWGGEWSTSQDGYDTLDISPYSQMLLASYDTMLNEMYSTWAIPTEEDLIGTSWYDDGYDVNGEYYMYRMELRQDVMDVRWAYPGGGENRYLEASWSLENKDGIAVLTVDFGEFAGVRSYNLLLDIHEGLLYTAVDATNGEIKNDWEQQYRFLFADNNAEPAGGMDPDNMVGIWERTYTEVEGDRRASEPGECTIEITGSKDTQLVIAYTVANAPDWSYSDVWLFVMPGEWTHFEDCQWKAMVNYSALETSHDISLLPDGTLQMVNYYTVDDIPMISYEWFQRVG